MSRETDLAHTVVRLLWRSVADDLDCSCLHGDICPECEAMAVLGLGRWRGAESARRLLTSNYGPSGGAS